MNTKSSDNIIDLISRIREAANLFIESELNSRGIEGVVPAHGMVFSILFKQSGPVPIMSLVKQSGRAKSTITGVVKKLEKHGYIYRQTSPEDGRSYHIGLTEKGWSIKSDFKDISRLLREKVYINFNNDEKEIIMNLLGKIKNNLF